MKKWIVMFLCAVLLVGSNIPFMSKVNAASMSDVPTNHWVHTAANWAVDNKVMSLQSGKFSPNAAIIEADLVKMFAQLDAYYPYSVTTEMVYNHYTELNIPLDGALSKAKRNQPVSREQFAVIFAAMHGYDLSTVQAVRYLYVNEITTGTNNKKTYESFNPKNNLTRAEAAAFIYRMAITKKMKLAVEGFSSKATGKDNGKFTIPVDFVESKLPDIELEDIPAGTTQPSPSTPLTTKEVQSVKVTNKALIANGVDSTLVTIKLKDSYGKTIPNDESLQFQISSKLNQSDVIAEDEEDYFGKVRISNTPFGAATGAVSSDGGELNFYVTAPKLTKSYKDTIYVELVNNNDKKYAGFKNKRIEVPVQYSPQPELRVSYKVYDASIGSYVGDNNIEQEKIQFYPETIPQGPITITNFDIDEKLITVEGQERDLAYEGATLSVGGSNYQISEYLFEKILQQAFDDFEELEVNLYKGINQEMALDIPFSVIPSTHQGIIVDAPETLAIVSYLLSLLPSSFNDFSIAYYDSVIAVQAIYNMIPDAVLNSGTNAKLVQIKNSMTALVELANNVVQAEIDAQKEKSTSHTKIAVSLVAPGGQIITNYSGNVEIEYNGVKQLIPFKSNTSDSLTGTGHAGAAVFVYDGLIYGDSEVKVTLVSANKDERYAKLLAALYDKPYKTTIFADRPIDDRDFYAESEVAVVVDLSTSMNKVDPYNHVDNKLKEMIERMDAQPTIAMQFNKDSIFLKSGTAEQVLGYGPTMFDANYRQGGTDLLNAVKVAINKYESIGDRSIQRNMLIVTDGKTKSGQITQIINLAKRNDIMVHIVTIGSKSEVNSAQMKRIATNTQGSYYHATSYKALSSALQGAYDAIVLRYKSDANICTAETMLEDSKMAIVNGYVHLKSSVNPNCSTTSVEKVKVQFFGDSMDLQLDLQAIGHNEFELLYDLNRINMFDVYEEIEFLAYNSAGTVIGSKRVKVQ